MDWNLYDAVLFDLDGVITPTADLHMRAWSEMLNGYLTTRGVAEPYSDDDYFTHVDGRPRYDGVRAFLASRGIHLPEGDPSDPTDAETVCGLGNKKNDVFNAVLARDGIAPFPGSVKLIDALEARGIGMAIVSSSKNARTVLRAAGLEDRFPVVVDGVVATERALPGKPNPDTFLHADDESEIAGRAGNFGLVVGVDRGAGERTLRDAGADVVVNDLEELL